jgi:hypothetical protein
MLIDGVLLGTMTTLGFCLIYGKLPPWMQDWMANHPLLTDIIVSCGFYAVMGMTLTAHFAVATMVLQVQGLLHIKRNPEKFLFLQAAKARARAALKGVEDKIDEMNEDWKKNNKVIDVA